MLWHHATCSPGLVRTPRYHNLRSLRALQTQQKRRASVGLLARHLEKLIDADSELWRTMLVISAFMCFLWILILHFFTSWMNKIDLRMANAIQGCMEKTPSKSFWFPILNVCANQAFEVECVCPWQTPLKLQGRHVALAWARDTVRKLIAERWMTKVHYRNSTNRLLIPIVVFIYSIWTMSSAPPPSTQHKRATFSCHAVPCRDVRKADARVWNFQLKCIQSKSLTALPLKLYSRNFSATWKSQQLGAQISWNSSSLPPSPSSPSTSRWLFSFFSFFSGNFDEFPRVTAK